jgi:protein O-mannosyl-transferase
MAFLKNYRDFVKIIEEKSLRFSPHWQLPYYLFLFLVAMDLLVYHSVWHAGFIWDDVQYVTQNSTLHSLEGLRQIWLVPGATAQYYPLTFTTFWLEYHIWGLNPLGFHLVNIFLHSFNAILFWILLKRLNVRGAWLATSIFALHPVCVESVAWVTERKNMLSGLFFLGSLLATMGFWLPQERAEKSKRFGRWKFYALSLGLYICALCSKTAVAPLPVVILLFVWWKRRKIEWVDVLSVIPFVAIGLIMGLLTMHIEKTTGSIGGGVNMSLIESFIIASWDICFYLGKIFWPYPLIPVYPHWEINASSVFAYLPALIVVTVLLTAWLKRNSWGRGVFVAVGYFIIMLSVVLGFFNVSYFQYSFVSDHFQYLAMLGPLALFAAGLTTIFNRVAINNGFVVFACCSVLFSILAVLTWRQCGQYLNDETLWRSTIAKNPDCWIAYNNLGHVLLQQGHLDQATTDFQRAKQIHPADAGIENNLGSALLERGDLAGAYAHFEQALAIQPDDAMTYNNFGDFYLRQGRTQDAIPYLKRALANQPDMLEANYNLGNAFLQSGDVSAAVQQWEKTLLIQPDYVVALNNIGTALLNQGQIARAIRYLQKAVAIEPNFVEAQNGLASALLQSGDIAGAVQHWQKALEIQPGFVAAQNNLAWILATCPQMSLRNGIEALKLANKAKTASGGNDPIILRTQAAAYAENGNFSEAIAVAQVALQICEAQNNASLEQVIQDEINFYKHGRPFRDESLIQTP